MNPETANLLAWIVVFCIGAGVLVLAVLGIKYLATNMHFGQPKQEYLTESQMRDLARKEAQSLFNKQETVADQVATKVAK